MKNNLIRGVRKASDFLMALQLTGAFKRDSLANLQVRLPAVVIGGGLTGIDTTTELPAYYPVQVEKFLDRWEALRREAARGDALAMLDAEEARDRARVPRARARRARRARARRGRRRGAQLRAARRAWGGVSLVYRKRIQDSPRLSPQPRGDHQVPRGGRRASSRSWRRSACVPDERGALRGGRVRSPRRRGRRVDGDRREGRAAGAQPVGRGRHLAQRHLRARAPGHVRDRSRAKAFKSYRAVRGADGGFGLEAGRDAARSGLLHLLPAGRPDGQLLRRQPPRLRRARWCRRWPRPRTATRTSGAVRGRDRDAHAAASSRRATPPGVRFADALDDELARHGRARRAPDRRPSSR